MNLSNKISKAGLFIGIVFTAFILFSVFHNWTNQRHTVVFFQGSQFTNYENTSPVAQIQVSPAIAWQQTSGTVKFLGWVFLVAMWFGIVASETTIIFKKKDPSIAQILLLIFGPLILSATLFLGGYSSRLSNNYREVNKDEFDTWVAQGFVEKKGEKTYVDKTGDNLKNLFKDRKFIK